MKRKVVALLVAATMAMSLAACGGSTGAASSEPAQETEETAEGEAEAEAPADDAEATEATGEFNPDSDPSAMTIEEVREKNGAEVAVENGIKLGAVQKSISNEFWRTLQYGYEEAAETVKAACIE
jgi:hypothetical protein